MPIQANYYSSENGILFDDNGSLDLLAMKLKAETLEPNIDFNWNGGYIGPTNLTENVAAVFEGYLKFDPNESYTLQVEYDTYIAIYIDGDLVPNLSRCDAPPCCEPFVYVAQNNITLIRIEYYHGSDTASLLRLGFQKPDVVCPDIDIIPSSDWTQVQCPPNSMPISYLAYQELAFCECQPFYYNNLRGDWPTYKNWITNNNMSTITMDTKLQYSSKYVPANSNSWCTKGIQISTSSSSATLYLPGALSLPSSKVKITLQYYNGMYAMSYYNLCVYCQKCCPSHPFHLSIFTEMTSSPDFEIFNKYNGRYFYRYTNPEDETIVLTSLHYGTLYKVTCKIVAPNTFCCFVY